MANFAIKGHASRGTEIIKILSMLGGNNALGCFGNNTAGVYYVDKSHKNYITCSRTNENNLIFTLEEFIEKFPYKVGDKVTVKGLSEYPKRINFMKWFDGSIHYSFDSETWFLPEALKIYKEESMGEKLMPRIDLTGYCKDKYILDLGNYEIKEEKGVTYMIHKKPQYPKTYEECCGVLKIPNDERYIDIDVPLDYNKLLSTFTKLLICRNTYWKIAGEGMGLGKPWEPDWLDTNTQKYCIYYVGNEIKKQPMLEVRHFLAFPTKELQDAFFEYFKDLIEECKELL